MAIFYSRQNIDRIVFTVPTKYVDFVVERLIIELHIHSLTSKRLSIFGYSELSTECQTSRLTMLVHYFDSKTTQSSII